MEKGRNETNYLTYKPKRIDFRSISMNNSSYKLIFTFCIALLIQSCDKINARKFEGTYSCTIEANSWMIGGPYSDTSYFGELVIERDGNELIIPTNWHVNVDSISNENNYSVGGGSSYYSIQLKNDSVYYYYHSGGLGGGSDIKYSGVKKK